MGKTKKPDRLELLEKENKELREINKSLARQLNKKSKRISSVNESCKSVEEVTIEKDDNDCPECRKSKVVHTDIGPRLISVCKAACGYRKITKKHVEKEKTKETSEEKEI